MRFCNALLITLLVLTSKAHAGVIISHSGSADPTTEGWSTAGTFASVNAFAVANDLGSVDAWAVDDNGIVGGTVGWYRYTLSAQEQLDAQTNGWKMSVNVRVVDAPDPGQGAPSIGFDASPFFSFLVGNTNFSVFLGSESDSDPTAWLPSGTIPGTTGNQYTVDGAGSTYNSYVMEFDPLTGTSFSINGTVLDSAYAGVLQPAGAPNTVNWGAGSSCCTGQGNFASVSFEVNTSLQDPNPTEMPVPASVFLLGVGLISLRLRRKN